MSSFTPFHPLPLLLLPPHPLPLPLLTPLIIASLLSSAQVGRLHWDDVPFERLEVSSAVAEDIFRHDEFKTRQIPFIVDKSRQRKEAAAKAAAAAAAETDGEKEEVLLRHPEGTVTCYRLGDHVDISSGKKQSNDRE